MSPKPITGYTGPKTFAHLRMSHPYYESEAQGPPVLLMHELPGLTPECKALADKLNAEGFHVVMPLFFGKPESTATALNSWRVCISREFIVWRNHRTSPIVSWLRALVSKICSERGAERAGVIGMCLSGNFALTLIAHNQVAGAVAAQPSLPMLREAGLAMSPEDLSSAADRARQIGPNSVLGLRYDGDFLCRKGRFNEIRWHFGDAFLGKCYAGNKHATLTKHLQPDALAETIKFLHTRLG